MAFKDPNKPIIARFFGTDNPPNKRIEISSNPANEIKFYSGEPYETQYGRLFVDSDPSVGSATVELEPPLVSPGPATSGHINITNSANGLSSIVAQADRIDLIAGLTGHALRFNTVPGLLTTFQPVVLGTLVGTWTTLGGGWPHPRYYKNPTGFIHLVGGVTGGAAGQTIMTLDSGYRPPYTIPCEAEGNLTRARISIRTTGAVVLDVGSGTNVLFNCTFPVANGVMN